MRTVPTSPWTKAAIDHWLAAAGFTGGPMLGAVKQGGPHHGTGHERGRFMRSSIATAKRWVRRTFAKLAHQGRAPLE